MDDPQPPPEPAEAYEGIITLGQLAQPQDGGRPRPLPGWLLAVSDAETGEIWTTVTDVVIHVPVKGFATAEVTMFADQHGRPIRGNRPPVPDPAGEPVMDGGGRVLLGTFRFLVAGLGAERKVMA